jgi:predicted transcriptional regulator
VAQIDRWLKAHAGKEALVVIDVLAKVKPPRSKYGDLYQEDYAIMSELKELCEHYHAAILVFHHTRKAESTDVFDELLGSTALAGSADTVMMLQRVRGKDTAVLHITGREIEREQQLALRFNRQSYNWEMLGDAKNFAMSPERREIVEVVKQLGEATPKQLAETLGKNASTLRTLLTRMAQQGIVRSTGRRTYIPVDTVDAAIAVDEQELSRPHVREST